VEIKIADQADGRVEPGATNPAPSWAAVDDVMKAGFLQGQGFEAGRANPHPWHPRAGANYQVLAPTSGFNRGERENAAYGRKVASNPRTRRNQAEVID
jgi:hypothetical protein